MDGRSEVEELTELKHPRQVCPSSVVFFTVEVEDTGKDGDVQLFKKAFDVKLVEP